MKFIAFSGGVESSTMCVLYGGKANAIFADTGFEHKELYERLYLVEKRVRKLHGNDFKIFRVQNKKYNSLPDYIKRQKFYPSFRSRFCTGMFKIEPIDDFLKQFDEQEVELMIGLNADETELRTGNQGRLKFVRYTYPLSDAGITRAMCENILRQLDLHPNFPVYMRRGGCKGCYYKSKKEFAAMYYLNRDEFNEVAALEESIQDERKEFYHIHSGIGKSMRKFAKDLEQSPILFSPNEIYSIINDASPCGIFCNR